MKYEHVITLINQAFRSVTGFIKETFAKMTEILKSEYGIVHAKYGRALKLSKEDNLLMMLEYYKEYARLNALE